MARKGYSLGSLTDYVNTKFNISGGEVTGNLNVQGILSEKGERVFSPNNKPTPEQIRVGRYWGYSDYLTGTLIETSLDAAQADGSSFTVDIISKSYRTSADGSPLHIIAEGYLFQDKIINVNGLLVGGPFQNELTFLKLPNGKLGIWFARQSYWNNYGVIVTETGTQGWKGNLVTAISDAAKPVSDKSADVSFNKTYGTYLKPTAADVGAVSKTGDTMTGALVVQSDQSSIVMFAKTANAGSYILSKDSGGSSSWFVGKGAMNSETISLYSYKTGTSINLRADDVEISKTLLVAGSVKAGSNFHCGTGVDSAWVKNNASGQYLQLRDDGNLIYGGREVLVIRPNYTVGSANGIFPRLQVQGATSTMFEMHYPGKFAAATVLNEVNGNLEWFETSGAGVSMKSYGYWSRASGEFYAGANGNFNDVYIRSDKRLKSNITPLEDNLSKVLQLNPVKYDKKKTLEVEETEEELGLIAQEVEEIIPLAVATSVEENQLKALKPYALIATLIGAVKELKAELDELKAQINQTK